MTEIATPCVKICVVDPVSGLCIGCGRSPGEIAAWRELSAYRRAEIMSGLEARMSQARSRAARGGRVRAALRGR
jgi:predicted Fe-S protein YdhL (DUF1289 family)